MENEHDKVCGCSGASKPMTYSLRLLIDMIERAEERKRQEADKPKGPAK